MCLSASLVSLCRRHHTRCALSISRKSVLPATLLCSFERFCLLFPARNGHTPWRHEIIDGIAPQIIPPPRSRQRTRHRQQQTRHCGRRRGRRPSPRARVGSDEQHILSRGRSDLALLATARLAWQRSSSSSSQAVVGEAQMQVQAQRRGDALPGPLTLCLHAPGWPDAGRAHAQATHSGWRSGHTLSLSCTATYPIQLANNGKQYTISPSFSSLFFYLESEERWKGRGRERWASAAHGGPEWER